MLGVTEFGGATPGNNLIVCAKVPPLWMMNVNKIVYVIDEVDSGAHRFGYGYGTLAPHAETGEERFLIEWDRSTDEVTYQIFAFSKPHHLLARLGKPLARHYQDRFRRDSARALKEAVSQISPF